MFVFLSKIFYLFLSPANWVIVLLLIRLATKRPRVRRMLLIAAVTLVLVFGNKALYRYVMNTWQPNKVALTGSHFEAGILLGGITAFDKNGVGYFADASDRLIQTVLLYRQGIIKKIVVSGGRIENDVPREADFIQTQLLKLQIPAQDIITENQSRNTFENAQFSKEILQRYNIRMPVVLITSAIHMPRAVKVFRKAGIEVVAYPCNYTVVYSNNNLADYVWPDAEVLSEWQKLLKEWVGLAIYQLTGKA